MYLQAEVNYLLIGTFFVNRSLVLTVNDKQENFGLGIILIYVKSTLQQGHLSTTLTARAVMVTVKQRTRNSRLFRYQVLEDNERIKNFNQFSLVFTSISIALN